MSLETSSPTHPANPFPLLRLPHELLDTIFEYAYEYDERPGPVCRALRQFAERRFWRDPVITTYRSLACFCRTVNSDSRLATNVRSLSLHFARIKEVNRIDGPGTRRLVDVGSFSRMLSRLDRLRSLRMVELDEELAQVLSSPDLEVSALLQLRILDFEQSVSIVVDKNVWSQRLATLQAIRLSKSINLPQIGMPMRAVKLIISGFDLDALQYYDFAAAFPALQHFEAHDLDAESHYRDIVSTLPTQLKRLHLVNTEYLPDMIIDGSLDDVLPNFDRLEDLYLCNGTFTAPRLRAYLDTANNLVSLGFGLNSPVTDDFLRSLVEGPTRLPQLRLSAEAKHTPFHEHPDWWEPNWPDGCTERGFGIVEMAARSAGIKIEGTVWSAYSWEDDYHQEVFDALISWGYEVDDFKEAREFYGDEFIDQYLSDIYSFV